MKLKNSEGSGLVKEILGIIRANSGKKIKLRCKIKNKLIDFIYHLKLVLTLSHIIKLFY